MLAIMQVYNPGQQKAGPARVIGILPACSALLLIVTLCGLPAFLSANYSFNYMVELPHLWLY
jgi:hypothetical protein